MAKKHLNTLILTLALLVGMATQLFAQGTAFTYQGRLNFNGSPAGGNFDLQFTVYDAITNGNQFGETVTNLATPVTNGLFTATMDFGPGIFDGAPRWLQIGVGTNGSGTFTTLIPRQPLTPTPYAIFANTASNLSGTVSAGQLTGTIPSGSIGAGSINGTNLAAGAAAANLAAGNQTAVPSGGVIMTISGGAQEPNLLNAGYVKIGTLNLIPESWNTNVALAAGPPDTGELMAGRVGHSAVWTGTEMIVWGGADGLYTDTLYNNGASYNPSANTWTVINPNSGLAARDYQAAVWTGSRMLIWGGAGNPVSANGNSTAFGDGASYNPTTDSWTPISTFNAPTGRAQASAVWTGTYMIVWGGYYNVFDDDELFPYYPTSGAMYNPVNNTWTAMNNNGTPAYTVGDTAVWTGTSMIVYGGEPNSGASLTTIFSGGSFNPANNTWSAVSSNSFAGTRYNHSAVWDGTNMIVWGGISAVTDAVTNNGASYNPAANTWTPIASAGALEARESHTAIWTGTQMIVWGGDASEDGYPGYGVYNDGASYSPAANAWTALTTNGVPLARTSHTALWTGTGMIIWGGDQVVNFDSYSDPLYQIVEPGGVYYPQFSLWESMAYRPGSGEPGARENATAVWTGSEMLIWGGDNSGFLLQSGGSFNLAANTWSPITITNAPSLRQNYTAVWTGNSMVVWGGENNGNTVSTGGRYYPATGAWAPTTTLNAPVNRASQVAVWDGTEMLVWGGYESALLSPAAGGRYNPLTDAWVPMNTTNEPPVAAGAAAVWAGTNMIEWGGISGNALASNFVATGGIYVPTLDAWTALPTNNAPSPRAGHSAVWTGTDFVVYGGYNLTTNLNTGARFTLASNTWTALSVSNAPPALAGDVVVWSGSKMLVYGGIYELGTSPILNPDVELYNPAEDTWGYSQQEEPVGAGFENACGVWAGTGFLVWGGYGGEESGMYSEQPFLYTPLQVMDLLLRP